MSKIEKSNGFKTALEIYEEEMKDKHLTEIEKKTEDLEPEIIICKKLIDYFFDRLFFKIEDLLKKLIGGKE